MFDRSFAAALAVVAAVLPCAVGAATLPSINFDLRIAGTGGKEAVVTRDGETVLMDLFAVITGVDGDPNNDSMLVGLGDFRSSTGGLLGHLNGLAPPSPWNAIGSTVGLSQDLDGDGDRDVGTNDSTSADDKYGFRGGGPAENPPVGQYVGRVRFTLSQFATDTTEIVYIPRTTPFAGFVDGSNRGFTIGTGAPVRIRGIVVEYPAGAQFLSGSITSHLTVNDDIRVTPAQMLTLVQGVTVNASGTLEQGQGTLTIQVNDAISQNAGGTLVAQALNVGTSANGTFTQAAGSTHAGGLTVGATAGVAGTLNVQGGALNAGTVTIRGTMNRTGGASQFYSLGVPEAGAVNLGAGSMQVLTDMRIGGGSGSPIVSHTAGQTDVGGVLRIASDDDGGSPAKLQMSGGTLSAGLVRVGESSMNGRVEQTGGTFSAGQLKIGGVNVFAAGTYALDGGTLIASNVAVGGNGVLLQTAGELRVTGKANALEVSRPLGELTDIAPRQVVISGGALNVPFLRANFVNSAPHPASGRVAGFVQTGGIVNADQVSIDGAYDLLGGSLNVADQFYLRGRLDFGGSGAAAKFGNAAFVDFVEGDIANAASALVTAGLGSLLTFRDEAQFAGIGAVQTQGKIHFAGNPLTIAAGESIGGTGTIRGSMTNSGTITPGHSPGELVVAGPFTQTDSGKLVLEIGGRTETSQFDVLTVEGLATLDGDLQISLIDGFTPSSSDIFQIISAATLSGRFDNASGFIDLPQGRFDVGYSARFVTLTNFQAVPEPGGLTLLTAAGVALLRRRRWHLIG